MNNEVDFIITEKSVCSPTRGVEAFSQILNRPKPQRLNSEDFLIGKKVIHAGVGPQVKLMKKS